MSTTVKVVLALVAFFFLMIAGTCAGAYYWFDQNQERLRAEGKRIEAEAVAFAQTHDERECLDNSFVRHDGCSGGPVDMTFCRAMASVFLEHCLGASRRTEGFCEGAPAPGDIVEGAKWAVDTCTKYGRAGDQGCGNHISRLIPYCSQRAPTE